MRGIIGGGRLTKLVGLCVGTTAAMAAGTASTFATFPPAIGDKYPGPEWFVAPAIFENPNPLANEGIGNGVVIISDEFDQYQVGPPKAAGPYGVGVRSLNPNNDGTVVR